MPTVLQLPGLRVVIYPNDHGPAHVHVIGGHEALFELNCRDGLVSLRKNFGFALHELNKIQKLLAEHLSTLCSEWERIHGHA